LRINLLLKIMHKKISISMNILIFKKKILMSLPIQKSQNPVRDFNAILSVIPIIWKVLWTLVIKIRGRCLNIFRLRCRNMQKMSWQEKLMKILTMPPSMNSFLYRSIASLFFKNNIYLLVQCLLFQKISSQINK
jgi:hypothetical protein